MAVTVSSSDCNISYDSIMQKNLIEISMIYDAICKHQKKVKASMSKA